MTSLVTFVAALCLAGVFLFGWRLRPHGRRWRRAGISASAGAAVAYVFVHLLPDLAEAAAAYASATAWRGLRFAELHVYLAALAGFTVFYGLEHLAASDRAGGEGSGQHDRTVFLLHTGGFAVYVAMVSYAMVRGAGAGDILVAWYALAMGLHFLSLDHSLLLEHQQPYLKFGRHILAAAVLVGWLLAAFFLASGPILHVLLGVIAGGVIINSMISELPPEKQGRFWPFVLGAGLYALLLLASRPPGES